MTDSYEKPAAGSDLPTVSEVRELFEELRGEWSQRNADYNRARQMYDGEHWDQTTNPPAVGRYSLVANYIRPTVDGAVRDLFGRMPGMQVVPPGVDEMNRRKAEALEAVLYQSWMDNEAPLVFRRVAHNAILVRRGILYTWWDPKRSIVRFRSCAPENFYPVYDGHDVVEAIYVTRVNTRLLRRRHPTVADRIMPDAGSDWVGSGVASTESGVTDALGDEGSGRIMGTGGQTTVYDWFDAQGRWVRVMGDARIAQTLRIGQFPFVVVEDAVSGDEDEPRAAIEDVFELNQYLDQVISQQADIIRKYSNPTIIDAGSGQPPEVVKKTVQGEGGVLPIRKDGTVAYLNWQGTPPDITAQFERVRATLMDLGGRNEAAYGRTITNQSGVMTNMALSPTVAAAQERMSIFGLGLSHLNELILRTYEKNLGGATIKATALRPRGESLSVFAPIMGEITGTEIGGWYHNRIKWPAVLRTDDPVYVQTEISKMTANPPVQSVYTTMENLGIEDVESERDRLQEQLQDPVWHPDRLQSAIEAAGALSQTSLDPAFEGLAPDGMGMAATAAGNPNRDLLAG